MPGLRRCPQCTANFGARAASSRTVSAAYRQAVAVLTPNPAARSANVSPLRR
jgi:hypothetical protein